MEEKKKRMRAAGGGRPSRYGRAVVPLNTTVSEAQKAKFHRLGGSLWLQGAIDSAEEGEPKSMNKK